MFLHHAEEGDAEDIAGDSFAEADGEGVVDDFFVFINAETEDVNVVYKRKGNTYGLIEPEY